MSYPVPANEPDRLAALQRYDVMDTPAESGFDDLTELAAYICGTPIALISLIDEHRQWFKSRQGLDALETPRELAFCAHAICDPETVLVVPNALEDDRFSHNPLVTDAPDIRFYAGTPLVTSDGYALGTLCAIDRFPRDLTQEQLSGLRALGRQVMSQLELRRSLFLAQQQHQKLRQTQVQLIQSERLAGLGHLTAGLAHEVNNPITFIHSNLAFVQSHSQTLFQALDLYRQASFSTPEIEEKLDRLDLEFVQNDLPKVVDSMRSGTTRIQKIVDSLRGFARLDESDRKSVNLNEGIEHTLEIIQHRLIQTIEYPAIQLIYQPELLPSVDCYASQINQVFLSLINNAIDALRTSPSAQSKPTLSIRTQARSSEEVEIIIADNGPGIPTEIHDRIFDPFFTTKPVGAGTGLGLSISHQIITEQHQGRLKLTSSSDLGTEFTIVLPVRLMRSSGSEALIE